MTGIVYLVGAGPGDPGLLTLKAKDLLERADVVVYDALISQEILDLIPATTERIYAGKRSGRHSLSQSEIIEVLHQEAQKYSRVVRLKGGDPFLFGRGGEEMLALQASGIQVEVVPGITAGMAAPAYLGIPVTQRGLSSVVTFVTGHEPQGEYNPIVNWAALAQGTDTLVVYMGVQQLPQITQALLAGGKPAATPVVLIRWGTTPQQEALWGTLATISDLVQVHNFGPPAVIVIGPVVALGWPDSL